MIDTANTALYFVLGQGRAIRYGVGVGREGFTWAGVQTITRKAEWPDWNPPAEMIARQPYLPRFMAGGPGNPLGARAMYLGSSVYRIHGTNDPSTIGKFVSSGCIRLTNEDVTDLFSRVEVGTKVVVLPKNAPMQARNPSRPVATALPRSAGDDADGIAGELSDDVMTKRSGSDPGNSRLRSCSALGAFAPAAQAQDFFSALFGGFGRSRAPAIRMPFGSEGENFGQAAAAVAFWRRRRPIACAPATAATSRSPATTSQSRAEPATAFARQAKPRWSMAAIDNAATENGKPYSELPNAFRYRNEIVADCTCNGKDPIGLASVESKRTPPCAKATSSRATMAWWSPAGREKRGASLEFLAGLGADQAALSAHARGGAGVSEFSEGSNNGR